MRLLRRLFFTLIPRSIALIPLGIPYLARGEEANHHWYPERERAVLLDSSRPPTGIFPRLTSSLLEVVKSPCTAQQKSMTSSHTKCFFFPHLSISASWWQLSVLAYSHSRPFISPKQFPLYFHFCFSGLEAPFFLCGICGLIEQSRSLWTFPVSSPSIWVLCSVS